MREACRAVGGRRGRLVHDNYFDLSPGAAKEVELAKADLSLPMSAEHLREALVVRSLVDSY
ncbi:glycoside hydrolase family 2 protein [Paenibacillus sp.]|uniref:glycoside hydrolase family 2 protein n=1 Tax=Paenibacillus sp. TaxID=58172 RepID=UPI002D5FBA92|nr:glycoside hydrolase family 2 protein [Paenibacillus sp.]HZG58345.1 glycoside hydrolase family 2 protein [Paenibacillus sp.]